MTSGGIANTAYMISTVTMKDKLEQIFDKHHYGFGEYNKDEIIKELLVLCNVVWHSEQLLSLAQYMCQHQNKLDGKAAKDYVQDFLSQ